MPRLHIIYWRRKIPAVESTYAPTENLLFRDWRKSVTQVALFAERTKPLLNPQSRLNVDHSITINEALEVES